MNHPLRVLIVEDCEMDVESLLRTLSEGGYDTAYQVVETPEAMRENLRNQTWDLITSDHPLPCFNESSALALAQEYCPEVPFIIVSGEIELSLAVSLMRSGAKDYIPKHEIARLLPAVERELLVAEQRREHQRTEAALQESTLRFKEVIENSLDALYKRNVITGQYEYLSPAAARLTGHSLDELKEQMPLSYQTLIHPDDVQEVERCFLQSLESRSNQNFQVDYRFIRKPAEYVWLQDRFTVLRDAAGTPQSFIGTVRDITEWKQTEESLISSHRQIQRILGCLQDAYVQADLGGHIIRVNPAAVTMFRYPSMEAMLGMPAANLYAYPQDRGGMLADLKKNGAVRDWNCQAIRQDGTVFWVSANTQFIREENGAIIGTEGEIRDITERKQLEAALQASEAKYRLFVETAIEGVASLDRERRLTFINHQFASMLGYTVEEMLEQPYETFMPEDQLADAEVQEQIRTQGQDAVYERCFLRKDGARHWALVSAKAILNAAGQFVGSFGMFTDINAHKQAEAALHELNTTLEHRVAERTAELQVANVRLTELDHLKDEFLSRISHELRTPLTGILISLELLETAKPEKRERYLQRLKQSTERMRDMIEDVLMFSQLNLYTRPDLLSTINLNEIVQNRLEMWQKLSTRHNLQFRLDLTHDLPRVRTDGELIGQAVHRLVTNAVCYTPAGSVIVSTALRAEDDQPWVTISVQDTGPGIPPDDLPHIFERFYRGHAAADYKTPGTGVGLAISREIAEKLGGRLTVETQVGAGSTFTLWLPVSA